MSLRLLLLLALAVLGGCADSEKDPRPIEGSAYRIGASVPIEDSELNVRILRGRRECASELGLGGEELEACLPRVDRATGETSLSFTLMDKTTGSRVYLPLMKDQVQVSHMGSPVSAPGDYDLVQHDPMRAGQLFVLLIDGSGSMYENDGERIKKVYRALLNRKVIDGFFPRGEQARTGVVLLRFSSEVRGLDGGDPVVLTNRRAYKAMVEGHLMARVGGFTHLYDAVQYSVTKLMEEPAIFDWLQINVAEPTIVVLTDGFNNEKGSDTCADNAPRLERTLEVIVQARDVAAAAGRPTVYSVGLGAPIRKGWEPEKQLSVSPRTLCGKHANRLINGDLEKYGIDNVSLAWMADAGGGASFVKRNHRGLAEVFQAAAAERYEWYTVRYRVDGFYHRQSFETRISLLNYAFAGSTIELHPSGWLDAPSGRAEEGETWVEPTPLRRSLAFVLPLLGLLVLLGFLGPATFNARRAIFRRARKR